MAAVIQLLKTRRDGPMFEKVAAYADAYLVALTRISGIIGGVFVMLLLSVIIFPNSASHQVQYSVTLSCPNEGIQDPFFAVALGLT